MCPLLAEQTKLQAGHINCQGTHDIALYSILHFLEVMNNPTPLKAASVSLLESYSVEALRQRRISLCSLTSVRTLEFRSGTPYAVNL